MYVPPYLNIYLGKGSLYIASNAYLDHLAFDKVRGSGVNGTKKNLTFYSSMGCNESTEYYVQ